jgi:GNAT superfamily N-acetyltransferase
VTDSFVIRRIEIADVAIVARHRAEMFQDMGRLPREQYASLVERTIERLRLWVPAGEYVGWFVTPAGQPNEVAAGAGVQLRRVQPHPRPGTERDVTLAVGRQALVVNVFTERPWRRRGLAKLVMRHVIAWCKDNGVETIVLHASDEGRPLYEQLGFVATNEMRLMGEPKSS